MLCCVGYVNENVACNQEDFSCFLNLKSEINL